MMFNRKRNLYPSFIAMGILAFLPGCTALSDSADQKAKEKFEINSPKRTIEPKKVPRITEAEMDLLIGDDILVTQCVIMHEGETYLITEEEYLFL